MEYGKAALKQPKNMDRFDAQHNVSWIAKFFVGCTDPRINVKGLSANR